MTSQHAGYYTSFNARFATPERIAGTFISNQHFSDLLECCHSLLIGPRGSGKTTLLKMLTQPALHAWTDPTADSIRSSVRFVGVYIPSDIIWHKQTEAALSRIGNDTTRLRLARALVATSTLKAFIQACQDRLRLEPMTDVTPHQITAYWKSVVSAWDLGNCIPTSTQISAALGRRVTLISALIDQLSEGRITAHEFPAFLFDDPILQILNALDSTDGLFKNQDRQWALCYDELEIVHPSLRNDILGRLRSTDQRLLFKLSTSPFKAGSSDSITALPASAGNDYNVITLWFPSPAATPARSFSKQLAAAVMSRELHLAVSAEQVLGHSVFAAEDPEDDGGSATYAPGSRFWQVLEEQAGEDEALASLLRDHGVTFPPSQLPDVSLRDQFLRKIKPTLFLRAEYRHRSRRTASLYSGCEVLYAMCEGNPRWLIGILTTLCRQYGHLARERLTVSAPNTEPTTDRDSPIPDRLQRLVLLMSARRFSTYLRNLPGRTDAVVGRRVFDLFYVIKSVGSYFAQEQLAGPFLLDPKGSFVVDEAVPRELIPLLVHAFEHGAIVDLDHNLTDLPNDPVGRRYRLSFMLSPLYRLPCRVNKEVSLSTILGVRRRRLQNPTDDTPPLWSSS